MDLRGRARVGAAERTARLVTDDRPQVALRLTDGEVEVRGAALHSRRQRLFFATLLGCRATEAGWSCPIRSGAPAELVVRIAQRLERTGFTVDADGAEADTALRLEVERVRSFARARAAAQTTLGLPATEDVEVPDEGAVLALLEDFGWNSTDRGLLRHQRQGLVHALSAVNAANFSVPGAGKTATALSVLATHLARHTIDATIVVGPLSSFRPWEREAAIALPGVLRVFRVRGLDRGARTELYRRTRPRDLLLMSYPTCASDRHELELLCRGMNVMLIVDESHRVKRFSGGQWSDALTHLARFARVKMILSGTPMPQGPRDLWSQFTILWPGEELAGSRAAYAARADANFGAMRDTLAPFFVSTPKAALGLEPATFVTHAVELAPLQREVYELIANRLIRSVPDAASWQDRVDALRRARPIRLLQAASNPDTLNELDGFFQVPPLLEAEGTLMERLHDYRRRELPAKFAWALDFLAELQSSGRKCVVWTSFVRTIDQFSQLTRERLHGPVFSVDGRVPAAESGAGLVDDELDETREQRIDAFLAADGFAVLVANPAACAESISLHANCHTALYLDRTYDCARWLQSIDRIGRLGLPAGVHVEVHVLEAFNDGRATIDALVTGSLARKEAQLRALLEDAELRDGGLAGVDSTAAAEGTVDDLDTLLRFLLGER